MEALIFKDTFIQIMFASLHMSRQLKIIQPRVMGKITSRAILVLKIFISLLLLKLMD
jgi:hypothetical protein